MPFQFIALGMRVNTGSPLSKLVWLYLLQECSITDAPNGKGYAEVELYDVAKFAQATDEEVLGALRELERLRLVEGVTRGGFMEKDDPAQLWIDMHLPMSILRREERKRIKATPDQIAALEEKGGYRCACCGVSSITEEVKWEVDHIIPQSIGGADVEENCQVICEKCNGRKSARVHWVDFLGGRR